MHHQRQVYDLTLIQSHNVERIRVLYASPYCLLDEGNVDCCIHLLARQSQVPSLQTKKGYLTLHQTMTSGLECNWESILTLLFIISKSSSIWGVSSELIPLK